MAKLLNSLRQPIYVIDDRRTIVFCNVACAEWVGMEAGDVLGLRCAYTSDAVLSASESVAAGLCPSPDAMAGKASRGIVHALDGEGRPRRRSARFFRLGDDPNEPAGLVCLVGEADLEGEALPPEVETAAADEATWLHDRLRQVRLVTAARSRLDCFLGDSAPVTRVREQIRVAAETDAAVLLVGPTGSGRDRAAAAIHYGRRPSEAGSLVPLACSLLGPDLMESTLRALCSADETHSETPRRSTLLLNDVDRLAPETQRLIMTLLAERRLSLRLIATTASRLDSLVAKETFRADLAAVLSTIEIMLPPLTERRADLPILAQMFLEERNAEGSKQLAGFSSEALDRLDAYDWPGNLDELASTVAEAHAAAEGTRVEKHDLPPRIELAAKAAAHPRREEETIVLDEFLAEIERELVQRALLQARGNKAQAARLLGLTRPRLYRRLVQLGLDDPAPED